MSATRFALDTLRRYKHNRRQWGNFLSDGHSLDTWHEILREQVDKLYVDITDDVSDDELELRIFKTSAVLFEMYNIILRRGEMNAEHNGETAEVLLVGDGVQTGEDTRG